MTDAENELDEVEAARRRDEVVKRMLATPPKPRAQKKGRGPKPTPDPQ